MFTPNDTSPKNAHLRLLSSDGVPDQDGDLHLIEQAQKLARVAHVTEQVAYGLAGGANPILVTELILIADRLNALGQKIAANAVPKLRDPNKTK